MKNTDVNLDDPGVYTQYDREGMLTHLHNMPQLCQQAWQTAMAYELPATYRTINKVIISGMGGSAIGGDLVRSLAASEAQIPIIIHRDYGLPSFVDDRTLVIVSSYSGTTEETLSSFERALETPARKLVITAGGSLKNIAEKEKIPVFSFNYKAPPRAALAFSFLPILAFLQKLDFISDKSADVADTVATLQSLSDRINEAVVLSRNPAKQLAHELFGQMVVVYGGDVLSEVAHRWKTQFNENSKAWSGYEVLPELNHNAVVGYRFPRELAEKIVVVLLHSSSLPERIRLRYRITRDLLQQSGINYQAVEGTGSHPLSQMVSLVLFGDYVSYYLAILYQVDPSPVAVIDYLKGQLREPTS
ncbi:MAG: bifunctional phosphoglucose/phosphomannose isomerase [Dehalococcoidales bacterium]|nr:bifunctional phosphoglucose/phosphomannose isomerase [Dehalococcoidales bacterium]